MKERKKREKDVQNFRIDLPRIRTQININLLKWCFKYLPYDINKIVGFYECYMYKCRICICSRWCLTCQHSFVISSFTSVHFPTLYSMPYCFWLSKSPDNLCSHFSNLFYSFFDMSSGYFVIVTASDIWKKLSFHKSVKCRLDVTDKL